MSTTFSQLFKRNIKLCCSLILNKFYRKFNSIKTFLFHLNNQQKAFAVGLPCMTSSSRGTSWKQHPTGTAQALPLRTKESCMKFALLPSGTQQCLHFFSNLYNKFSTILRWCSTDLKATPLIYFLDCLCKKNSSDKSWDVLTKPMDFGVRERIVFVLQRTPFPHYKCYQLTFTFLLFLALYWCLLYEQVPGLIISKTRIINGFL